MEMIAFVIGVVVLVVGLAVSIALHEIGHLVPAKKFGVRVGQYMVGFGPTLFSRRRGETEYGIKAIPLGGYISMAGMYPPSKAEGRAGGGFFATMVQDARVANDESLEGVDESRVFYRLPVWKRIVIMLGGPFMNLLFAIVLMMIVLSGIGVQTVTTTVGAVSDCVATTSASACTADDPLAPAAAAGMEAGDEIVSIDGQEVADFAEAAAIIQDAAGQSLRVVVDRDGEQVALAVTPAEVTRTLSDGTEVQVGVIGITGATEFVREPLWAAPVAAAENVVAVAEIVVQMPVKVYETAASLVTGEDRDPNGPLSIVGAGAIAGEVAAADAPIVNRIAVMLSLLASLNIALFVFNLVPLLPLDGGHVVVALWDGIRRKWAKLIGRPEPGPIDATKLVPVTFVVVIAIVVMGGVLILADLINPVSLF
ncbi:site-2 protease family protein [Microbacterium sediminicola]|uniref:Site-2 protease family protein n=1 Tax=Microbacterium sediminicola TaxID=415210 RepID=A0ABN2HM71_9MICO